MLTLSCDDFSPTEDMIPVFLDEVGRGCLAGTVVASAVIWPKNLVKEELSIIKDSKKLSEKQRHKALEYIKLYALEYSLCECDNTIIDDINILQATYKAMHGALDKLKTPFTHIVIDGNRFKPYKNIPFTCVVGGDAKLLPIAAASIIAKIHRDDQISEQGKSYPQYDWAKNKGYGTKTHMAAIKEHGPSPLHRLTFLKGCLPSVS